MKLTRIAVTVALISLCLSAAAQLPGDPPWRAGAQGFEGRDGVIYADGNPFLLIYDFTWSAERDDRFYEFAEDWGNTTTYAPVEMYDPASAHHVFYSWSGSVGHAGGYLRDHPEAAMINRDGRPARRAQICYLNSGYREFLGAQLAELADSLRDRPYQLGYYPQDEFAYREVGCYCPVCRQAFADRMRAQYRTIAALNQAWGTDYADFDAIEMPTQFERSRRFCDWQEFRRWSQLDFAKFVYDTLKQHDPNHLVIWSIPFWGSWTTAAGWWDFPEVSDVLMRHGIGYQSGIYRFSLLRDIAEWSGDPGNALAMPPDYNPGYVQMSLIMDCPRTGLSHVCIAGAPDPTYQGVANSDDGYARREPMYTVSRSINNQMYQLGDIYLHSRQRTPQVGVYVSDRTVLVNGTDTRALNGVLLMLHDLNLDFQTFSERNLGDLARYPAIIAGPFSRVANDEIAEQFRDYVAGGGHLMLLEGAFAADWYNQDVGGPGFGLDAVIGSTEAERVSMTAAMALDAGATVLVGLPAEAPVQGELSVRASTSATVVGTVDDGRPIATLSEFGEGRALYVGANIGSVYAASWTDGFRDVLQTDEQAQALDDNAYGYDFRPSSGPDVQPAKGAKAWAQLLRAFLRSAGIGDNVVVEGYTDAIGVLKAKSFRTGDAYWVGLANRIVQPGADHRVTPPEELHRRLTDLPVRVRLDADGSAPEVAWLLANTRRVHGGRAAVPEVLPLTVEERDGARWASFTLPELIDFANVVLMPAGERAAVLGVATDRETMTARESITATATVINTSGARLAGTVAPGLEEGLACADDPAAFDLAPGERVTADFTISAPAGIAPDYYQLNMIARLDGGAQVVSPWVEVHVLRDIIVRVDNDRTIFPLGHLEPVLPVTVTVNTAAPAELTASVELPEGFAAEQASLPLRALAGGDEQTVSFRFTTEDDTPRVADGALTIAGRLRGERFALSFPLRLAVGTVIYEKQEEYRLGASGSLEPRPLVCLENSHLLATIVEGGGWVHDLVLRDTNTDHLVPTAYPFGWVWYGFSARWRRDDISGCGDEAWLRLRGTHPDDGSPITMTYTLAEGENHLRIDIDSDGSGPVAAPFYLMSRIGIDGRDERTIWPTPDGLQELPWRGGQRDVPAEDFAEHWLAVQDDATGQTFGCIYSFDSLHHVNLFPGNSNFNYMIFYPRDDLPIGNITFALSATLGGVEEVQALYERLGVY